MRNVPPELLSAIFKQCVSGASEELNNKDLDKTVFTLSLVCTQWRDVCFDETSSLWARLGGRHVAAQALGLTSGTDITSKWLQRAKGYPLDVRITAFNPFLSPLPAKQVSLPVIARYAESIGLLSIKLENPSRFIPLAPSDLPSLSFPVLRALEIAVHDPDSPPPSDDPFLSISSFIEHLHAPELRHLLFSGESMVPSLQTLAGQLCTLDLTLRDPSFGNDPTISTRDGFRTLQSLPDLTYLKLTLLYVLYADTPPGPLLFPRLETLSLQMEDLIGGLYRVLDFFTCPNLGTLDIFLCSTPRESELFPVNDFYARSGSSLRKLVLRGLKDVYVETVWSVVKTMDTLEELFICRLSYGFDLLPYFSDHPLPLRRLHTLVLTSWIVPEDETPDLEEDIDLLIRSRCHTDGTVARWRDIQIARDEFGKSAEDDGEIMSSAAIENLQSYIPPDLKLNFVPYPSFGTGEEKDWITRYRRVD